MTFWDYLAAYPASGGVIVTAALIVVLGVGACIGEGLGKRA